MSSSQESMSSSSSSAKPQVEEAKSGLVQARNEKPRWIEGFLQGRFFESCSKHPIHGNKLNKFCITCIVSGCQYCMTLAHHRGHKILKIYRHVYQDAVLLCEITKYLDCKEIQSYKCNQAQVVAVKPLPHLNGTSRSKCVTCCRRITGRSSYRYCSVECKVIASFPAPSEVSSSTPTAPLPELSTPNSQIPVRVRKAENSGPRRPRKGKPFRAPFF